MFHAFVALPPIRYKRVEISVITVPPARDVTVVKMKTFSSVFRDFKV